MSSACCSEQAPVGERAHGVRHLVDEGAGHAHEAVAEGGGLAASQGDLGADRAHGILRRSRLARPAHGVREARLGGGAGALDLLDLGHEVDALAVGQLVGCERGEPVPKGAHRRQRGCRRCVGAGGGLVVIHEEIVHMSYDRTVPVGVPVDERRLSSDLWMTGGRAAPEAAARAERRPGVTPAEQRASRNPRTAQPTDTRISRGPRTAKHSPGAQHEASEPHAAGWSATAATLRSTPPQTL